MRRVQSDFKASLWVLFLAANKILAWYSFISVHDVPIGRTPFSSMSVNALALIINVLLVYIILSAIIKVGKRLKKS